MAYDPEFYALYEAYLAEPRVRTKHDQFFRLWETIVGQCVVADLGCGRGQEYRRNGRFHTYTGFDQNADTPTNYRDPGFIDEHLLALDPAPDVFLSLFSTEITASPSNNQAFYEVLFSRVPSFTHGLVTGFYYTGRLDQNPVQEAGDLVSWQTLSRIEDNDSSVYDELRLTAAVPSKLFGEDVIEVWRVLTRR